MRMKIINRNIPEKRENIMIDLEFVITCFD